MSYRIQTDKECFDLIVQDEKDNQNKQKQVPIRKKIGEDKLKTKQFRLRGKKFFLTYPQVDRETKNIKELALEQFKKKFKSIKEYLIGEENHEDGGLHLHCFFELNVKEDISDVNFLDLIFDDKKYHGNYQIGKRKEALKEYITKEDNFITDMILFRSNGRILKPEEHLFNVCNEEGYKKAEESLYEYYPLIAAKKGSSILKNLSKFNDFRVQQAIQTVDTSKVFELTDFDKIPPKELQTIIKWMQEGLSEGFTVTLVLFGPPGTGKTQLGRALFKALNIGYVEISDIEDFKKLDLQNHKGILIDDVDFEKISRGMKLNILDSRASKTINVKYGAVSTKGYIPRIVTVNDVTILLDDLPELKRRTRTVFISRKISSKFDVQINVQNNFYFGDQLGISKEVGDEILDKLNVLLKERKEAYVLEAEEEKNLEKERKKKVNAYEQQVFNMRNY